MANRVNWRQAAAEVGLLFLGAAIAFGVDRWADISRARASEQEHLVALRADFRATDSIFRSHLTGYLDQQRHNRSFIQLLRGVPGSVSVDSVSGLVRKAFLWFDPVPVLATYEDLVNSGELSVIRDETLRIAMAEFVKSVEGSGLYNEAALEQWSSQVTPYYIAHFNVTELYGPQAVRTGDMTWRGYDWGPPVARLPSRESAFWSREFLNLLAVRTMGLGDTIREVERSIGRIAEIIRLIDHSIEPS